MNWTEAQSFCRKQHSDLASIRNESENQQVQQLVPAGTKVWTGLYRDGWKWSDGSRFSFSYWKDTEPNNNNNNEKCVMAVFDAQGKWEDWPCDVKKAFICSTSFVFQKVVSVRLEKPFSLDLNSAAVKEELLSQLLLKLKQEGLTADVKLSWRKQSDGNVFHKVKEKNPISV
ncbi:lectin-like [Poeciliopsis prolifica]|uniref:lectin-like n=1 Tax=Poeciliopsis prolifica TaxID=188132 RepID=UPI0024143C72|nr:lectin-like [Poeciliopsis prolifica]